MKTNTLIFFTIILVVISCQKNNTLKNKSIQDIVFQGKYLGEGCASVIQVTEPSLKGIGLKPAETRWGMPLENRDTIYDNAVAAGVIPEAYKDGETFYFTVSRIDTVGFILDYCSTPKFSFVIKSISPNKLTIENNK